MSIVVVEKEYTDKLIESFNEFKKLIESQSKPITTKPSSTQKLIDEIKNYIPLVEAWSLLNINKQKWYRTYQYKIQHKTYNNNTWVYLPSILKFLQTNNVNE